MPSLRFVLADVFTDRPLSGNQLAVFPHAEEIPEELLQPLARELNLQETVFVYPPAERGDARIRIFTTINEILFAGHPILGTACVVAREFARAGRIDLETATGVIPVEVVALGEDTFATTLAQPVPSVSSWSETEELLRVLSVEATLPVEKYDNGAELICVSLDSAASVAAIEPDFPALGRICDPAQTNLVGIVCFARDGDHYTARVFYPYDHVPEDAGCGSASGMVAAHLLRHRRTTSGQEIVITQGEQVERLSTIRATATGTPAEIEAVRVGGAVRIVGRGEFTL